MKKISLLILFVFACTVAFGQNLDFEQTGFEIKPIAMNEAAPSALSYVVSQEDLPSQFTLGQVLPSEAVAFSPVMEENDVSFYAKNNDNPAAQIAPLTAKQVFAFANDGSIRGVKNIAYKPSTGGNIADAYCRALYASRSN